MGLWCPIMKRKAITIWIHASPIEKWTLILKVVEREGFLMNPKHQCHLSEWIERVYGAELWKEMRLLCDSVFVLIDWWTLILKKMGKKAF